MNQLSEEQKMEALKEIMPGNVTMMKLDDTFDFECQQCGGCCINRHDIIMNPFDIYQIAKNLHISCNEVIDKYMDIEYGAQSRIPMVLLASNESDGYCPFLKFDIKDGCKYKCTINDFKPGACDNHPIGVAYEASIDDVNSGSYNFIKVDQCPNSQGHNHPVTVRDWTQKYRDNMEDIQAAHALQLACNNVIIARDFRVVMSFFDRMLKTGRLNPPSPEDVGIEHPEKVPEDFIMYFADMMVHAFTSIIINFGYANFDTDRPFKEQAEEHKENMLKGLDLVKQGYECVRCILNIPDGLEGKKLGLHISQMSYENGLITEEQYKQCMKGE